MEHLKQHWKKYMIVAIAIFLIWYFFLRKKSVTTALNTGVANRKPADDKAKKLSDMKAQLEKCYKDNYKPGVAYIMDPCASLYQQVKAMSQESGFGVPPASQAAADETRAKLQALIDRKSACDEKTFEKQATQLGILLVSENATTTMEFNPRRARVRTMCSKCVGDKCPCTFKIISIG